MLTTLKHISPGNICLSNDQCFSIEKFKEDEAFEIEIRSGGIIPADQKISGYIYEGHLRGYNFKDGNDILRFLQNLSKNGYFHIDNLIKSLNDCE